MNRPFRRRDTARSTLRMVAATFTLTCAVALPAASQAAVHAPAGACEALRNLRLADTRLAEVVAIADSAQHGDNVRAPHCRVMGVTGKSIAFVVILPDAWNQRLLMGGNGGFAGTINRGVLANATGGFVTVSTNTGHDASPGGGARWAFGDLDRTIDYGYLGVHRAVDVAKALAKAFYGVEPHFSYFDGCSNGGRQALMEAQRYPDDFDGIIAGAPAAQFTRIAAAYLKNVRAVFPDSTYFDKPVLTQTTLDLLAARVLDACDALDGVKDGIIADPRACTFTLSSIAACPGNTPAADCLTTAQRAAIATIYGPAMSAGRQVYPGQPFGAENLAAGWPAWITGSDTSLMRQIHVPNLQAMFLIEGAKYMTFGDTTWNYARYNGSLVNDTRALAPVLNADNPDITRFAARKGKLLMWHGWADPALNPLGTIEYYDAVLAADPHARDDVRLFMLPGVLHCGGGPGPSTVAWTQAIIDWVEHGQAPERLVASRRDNTGRDVRSRPLCAYPARAVYKGTGSTDDAANFSCQAP